MTADGMPVDGYEPDDVAKFAEATVGPFRYRDPDETFAAWGYTCPSGYTVVEWEPLSDDVAALEDAHQSVYHSIDDFRTVCTGEIEWGVTPDAE